MLNHRHLVLAALFLSALPASLGCSSDDKGGSTSEPSGGTVVVNIEAAQGDVLEADFCAQYGRIYCQASTPCCQKEPLPTDEDKCLAAVSCPVAGKSAAEQSGKVRYDAAQAGEFLRSLAHTASLCQDDHALQTLSFFVGTVAEGGDCSSSPDDPYAGFVCAPGLRCNQVTGDDGKTQGVCQSDETTTRHASGEACESGSDCESGRCDADSSTCASKLTTGQTCADDRDCVSGQCTDGSAEPDCSSGGCTCAPYGQAYCASAGPETPSNADFGNPSSICVSAHSSKNSGTTNDLEVTWYFAGVGHKCTITGGVGTGKTACCTPTSSSGVSIATVEFITGYRLAFSGGSKTDGLRVTNLSTKAGSSTSSIESFTGLQVNDDSVEGCKAGTFCNSFWLDNDGHGGYTIMLVDGQGSFLGYNMLYGGG